MKRLFVLMQDIMTGFDEEGMDQWRQDPVYIFLDKEDASDFIEDMHDKDPGWSFSIKPLRVVETVDEYLQSLEDLEKGN